MKTIPIENLLDLLNSIDLRTVRKWCKKNGVLILRQAGCEFVIESEFREVYERPFVEKLKRKFGAEWEIIYKLHVDGNISALHTLHQIPEVSKKAFEPNNKKVNEYLEKFRNYGKSKAA